MTSTSSQRPLGSGVALLAVLTMCAPASALTGEGQIFGGANLANLHKVHDGAHLGVGAQLGLQWPLSDFWRLRAELQGSYHFSRGDEDIPGLTISALSLGAVYALDIIQYVPYVGLAAVGYLNEPPRRPESAGLGIGSKLIIGVDWRRSRYWSLGFTAEIHTDLTQPLDFPTYSTIGAHLTYHFRLF